MSTVIRRAVGYFRYSSEAQRDSTSIDVQREQCERCAGESLAAYVDEARTGRALAGREHLHRLMADAAEGKIARVYVYRFDRLGRNESDTFGVVEELESVGVEVISATEGRDVLTRGMMLVMSAHYSRELAQKTRNGLLKRHEQRAFTGGVTPFGFKVTDQDGKKALAVDDDEARTVRDVYAVYLGPEPMGLKSIAKWLNDRGIPTRSMIAERQGRRKTIRKINRMRSATPWTKSSIRSILENPIYTGVVVYNRRRMKLDRKSGKRIPVMNDAAAQQSYREDRLRIISDEHFEAVRAKLAGRKLSTSRQARSADLIRTFTGHLFCEHCGSAFYSRKSENSKGVYVYYQCGCRQRKGPDACPNSITLREDKLLAGLQEVCSMVFGDIDAMASAAVEEAQQAAQGNRIEADRLRGELAQVDRELSRVAGLLVDPDVLAEPMAKKTLLRKASEVEGRREALQGSLAALLDKANDDTGRLAEVVRAKLLDAKKRWEAVASPAQLNQLIGEFVGPSVVTSDGRLLETGATKNPAHANDVHGVVAGGGFEPPTSGL
jgi:DNA invertase Pin-like site-specific DNA recombinase